MTWSLRHDAFSGMCTILDGNRLVAENLGKGDAERIVRLVNEDEREWRENELMFNSLPLHCVSIVYTDWDLQFPEIQYGEDITLWGATE